MISMKNNVFHQPACCDTHADVKCYPARGPPEEKNAVPREQNLVAAAESSALITTKLLSRGTHQLFVRPTTVT